MIWRHRLPTRHSAPNAEYCCGAFIKAIDIVYNINGNRASAKRALINGSQTLHFAWAWTSGLEGSCVRTARVYCVGWCGLEHGVVCAGRGGWRFQDFCCSDKFKSSLLRLNRIFGSISGHNFFILCLKDQICLRSLECEGAHEYFGIMPKKKRLCGRVR